jgi:hypothetical protein
MIETAMVGRDGVGNGTSALDAKVSLHKGIVQVAGTASVILPDVLRKLADEFEPLRGMLIRHEQVLFAQAQQSASLRTPVDGLGHQVRINAPFFVVTATCPVLRAELQAGHAHGDFSMAVLLGGPGP